MHGTVIIHVIIIIIIMESLFQEGHALRNITKSEIVMPCKTFTNKSRC